jgi:hypothetical protein
VSVINYYFKRGGEGSPSSLYLVSSLDEIAGKRQSQKKRQCDMLGKRSKIRQ